jgi:hypothetical protein
VRHLFNAIAALNLFAVLLGAGLSSDAAPADAAVLAGGDSFGWD